MTAEPTAAFRLFVEHYDHLLALVRQRLTVFWQFQQEGEPQPSASELLDYSQEFGRLLRVVFRYQLLDALQEETAWYAAVFTARGAGQEALTLLLDSWLVAIQGLIKPPECNILAQPLQVLRADLPHIFQVAQVRSQTLPPPDLAALVDLLTTGEVAAVQALVSGYLSQGTPPYAIITGTLLPALVEIGRRWEQNSLAIYQEHLATETIIRLLCALPAYGPVLPPGERLALVTCVPGDEHQLLPLALGIYLELRGWRVRSLGRSLPLDQIGAAAAAFQPEAIFLSLTMVSRLEEALATVAYLKTLDQPRRLIMGGPGTQAAAAILAEAGVRVVKTFEEAHAVGLSGDWHA
jgi:methanogenic corrinoid protein MtbC1